MKRSGLLLVVLVSSFVLGCPKKAPPAPAGAKVAWKVSKSGEGFRLSEADEGAAHESVPLAKATILSAADTDAVLARLPPLAPEPADVQSFALRDKSTPAPRPGKTITDTFPPPVNAPPPTTPVSGPLKVTRRSPEGNVELAPFLSVSFSQALVAVTSHAELAKVPPPVKLVPQPPGEWRWLGTQTVVFQPTKRFPMSTDYQVEVPAGTRPLAGDPLAAPEKWTFSTPALRMTNSAPSSGLPVDLEPLLYAQFDQSIDPKAVLAVTKLVGAAGSAAVSLRLAAEAEVEASKIVRVLSSKAEPNRWLAFRAEGKLATATAYTVTIGPEAPSLEGPKKTTAGQAFGFRTYGPMKVEQVRCSWSGPCPPLTPFTIQVSNAIDTKKLDKSMIHVSPDLPAMKISASGQYVTIQGRTKGRTRYKITVDASLPDTFGQTIGKAYDASIDVGPADQQLFSETADMSVLDPSAAPGLPVFTVNEPSVHVRLYAVEPADWAGYRKYRQEWDAEAKDIAPPGRLVQDAIVATKGAPDELTETRIDLKAALTGGLGQIVAIVEPNRPPPPEKWRRQRLRTWLQVTKLGLDAFVDNEELVGWTTDLKTGAPIDDVVVSLLGAGSGKSGNDGLARIPLTDQAGALLYGRKGADVVVLPEGSFYGGMRGRSYFSDSSFRRLPVVDQPVWLVFDDRRLYRPGDEPHVKGWLRRQGMQRGGDIGMTPDTGKPIAWTVRDSRGAEVAKGQVTIDPAGGFDFTFKVPTTANLGQASVQLAVEGSGFSNANYTHSLSFEEFRRPEFEVNAETTSGPHLVGGHAVATVSATYFAGGGLPSADVAWTATSSPGSFTPPNRSEYAFGPELTAAWHRGHAVRGASEGSGTATFTSKTGPTGAHRLRVDFDALERPRPLSIQLSASVVDVNRQSWTARASLLVHPANVYVGLKRPRGFVRGGDAIDVDAIVSDLDGKLVGDKKIVLRAARLDWEQDGDEWVEKEKDPSACEVDSKSEPVHCKLKTKEGGSYRIMATVSDAEGRKSSTEMRVWVLGEKMPVDRDVAQDLAQVVTDKDEYKAGDTAEVLVIAPFAPAEGVLVVERQGMVKLQRFTMKTQAQTINLEIEDAWAPGAGLAVHLVGADARTNAQGEPDPSLPKRPAFAVGSARLKVPPTERALAITVHPREKAIEPGGSTMIDIDAKNAHGEAAARTELALVVVDEAVLALSGYKLPAPLDVFYTQRADGTRQLLTRPHVLLAKPEEALAGLQGVGAGGGGAGSAPGALMPTTTAAASAAPADAAMMTSSKSKVADAVGTPAPVARHATGASAAREEAPSTPMTVRKDFAALALFAAKLTTDDRGHAAVPVKVPDSLTRYRVMVVAVQGENRFGSGESTLTARLPLMVRASPPRFLNYGDSFEMPIVVQNQTDQAMVVDVAMRAANAKVEATGRRVSVPPNDRVEVRIPASAAKVGTARFQIGGASGRFSDANQLELVVWTPATTEAFATYGTIDEGAIAQAVKMPAGVAPQFGGLEITTSSTALQALTDAVLYLVHYPYECNEQLSSRIVSIAALRDVLGAFQTKDMPAPEALLESMKKDIDRLKARQTGDGSWAFWPGGETNPFVTVHVTHALVRAKDKGFDVDAAMLERAKGYLRNIESHLPAWYSQDARRPIIAYALNVRWRMGDADRARARRLIAEAGGVEKLSLETDGWLLSVLSGDAGSAAELARLRRHFANRVTETAGAAHFVTSYSDASYLILSSDRRADGVILEALILDQPKNDVIPKIVTGLLAHRTAGHWSNTQENAFVLLALDKYFNTYEKTTPDFVARAWLGDRYAGEHAFKGRTTERHEVKVPMLDLADYAKEGTNLVLQKQGAGRLYYRIGMQYAPSDLRPPAMDRGFTVTRAYEGADQAEHVKQDADGTWRVKSGTKVRVRVGMVATSRRYHVALVDPLPAGFEVVNPALAVSGPVPQDPSARTSPYWWWRGTWYEHQNIRDERVEAFTTLLSEGVYDYTYVARATTPGTFIVAPPKAEEMYAPETFGRGAGDRVIVE